MHETRERQIALCPILTRLPTIIYSIHTATYHHITTYYPSHPVDDEETGRGARDARSVGGAIESDIDGNTRGVGTSE